MVLGYNSADCTGYCVLQHEVGTLSVTVGTEDRTLGVVPSRANLFLLWRM